MLDQPGTPPPLAVSFPDGIINDRHRYSVIEDDATRTATRTWGGGYLSSWILALGLWCEQTLPSIGTGAALVAWVGVAAWVSFNLFFV
jgi:hypothetical protein